MNRIPEHMNAENIETLFYKYRADLGEGDRNLRLISECEVFLSVPVMFNDPFDCFPVPSPASTKEIEQILKKAILNPAHSQESRERARVSYASNPAAMRAYMQRLTGTSDYVKEFVRDYGIFCLSKSPVNRLLWSHYGGSHSGFAIEFDIKKYLIDPPWSRGESSVGDFLPLPVKYSSTRPKLEMSGNSRTDALLTKDKCWEYEDEHRIVIKGGARLINYDPEYLSSVVVGALATVDTRKKIEEAITTFNQKHSRDVQVYQVQLSQSTYELHVPGHPVYS